MTSSAPVPPDEAQRLAELRSLLVLDTQSEPLFQSIAQMASQACGVPVALLSLIDQDRQWFKANVGLTGVGQTPRDMAFCAHAILSDELFVVSDASQDPRFANNPLVTGAPDIRFYAGVPLRLRSGQRMGTLCVIDRQARQMSPSQRDTLAQLAGLATQALEMRAELLRAGLAARSSYEQKLAASEEHYRQMVEVQGDLVSLADDQCRLLFVNAAYARHFDCEPQDLVGTSLFDLVPAADHEGLRRRLQQVLASGEPGRGENRVTGPQGRQRWMSWHNHRQQDAQGRHLLHSVGRDITDRRQAEQALRDLTEIIEHTPDFVVQTDLAGQLLYLNPAARQALSMGPHDALSGLNFQRFNTAQTQQRFVDEIWPAVRQHGVWVGETTVRHRDDAALLVSQMVIAHRDRHGRIERLSSVMRDIREQRDARNQLQRHSATLRAVIDAMPAIVAVLDRERRYRIVNQAFERWIGVSRDQLIGRSMAEVLGAAEAERSRPWVDRVLAGETVSFEKSYPQRDKGSHLAVSNLPLWLDGQSLDGFVTVAHDITEHRREADRLQRMAQRDALTGLLNRRGLEHTLAQWMDDGLGPSLTLLYIDLDHFKQVNDHHGHPVGDLLLQQFALRLRQLVRPTDLVARLGGDEFAIALCGLYERSVAQGVADKVLEAAHEPFQIGELSLCISASVGVAVGADARTGWTDLVSRADSMLYRAKHAGRGRQAGAEG